MTTSVKCAHPSCNCDAAEGRKYCSPHCEKSAKTSPEKCECNHAECKAKASAGSGSFGSE
jgi:hypothetical protein